MRGIAAVDDRAGRSELAPIVAQSTWLVLARRAVDESWTVRKTEEEARRHAQSDEVNIPQITEKSARRNEAVEAQLRAAIGAPVRVVQKKGKGRIEVRFHSFEELERLIDIFSTFSDG